MALLYLKKKKKKKKVGYTSIQFLDHIGYASLILKWMGMKF